MIRDIDIGQIRTFIAVAEHRNMTNAATLRNLTQSAVSQQIKRLEDCLDCQLLVRNPTGVSLTAEGQKLLPQARAMLRANDDTLNLMLSIEVGNDVRLGVPQDIVSSLLPKVLGTFHKAHPDVNIVLISASSRQLVDMLKTGELDLALTTDRRSDDKAKILLRKRLVWIGAIGGSAYLKSPLPVAVGHESCPFRQAASTALNVDAVAWRAVTQVGSLEPVFATLMADIAVAPFLPGTLPPGTAEIPESLPLLPEFFLHVRTSTPQMSASAQALLAAIEHEFSGPEHSNS